ncbi:MAG: hypothetical protein M1812_002759 [Candelaria pacifica]|nr:MAG: hypothetical protein M1812_002759 [Candelaria pacifica]
MSTPTSKTKSPLILRLLRNSPTVTINVGPTARWQLPTKLLTHQSPFFAACLHPSTFSESQTLTIQLPEDDPEIFDLFVQWLFTGSFENENPQNVWTEKAWVLGDKLGVGAFKDLCMRVLWGEYSGEDEDEFEEEASASAEQEEKKLNEDDIKETEETPRHRKRCNIFPPTIVYVYENTSPGSKLRQFFTDMIAENLHALDLSDGDRDGDVLWVEVFENGGDFVVDLFKAVQVLGKEGMKTVAEGDEDFEGEEGVKAADLFGAMVGDGEESVKEAEGKRPMVNVGCPSKPIGNYLEGEGNV